MRLTPPAGVKVPCGFFLRSLGTSGLPVLELIQDLHEFPGGVLVLVDLDDALAAGGTDADDGTPASGALLEAVLAGCGHVSLLPCRSGVRQSPWRAGCRSAWA